MGQMFLSIHPDKVNGAERVPMLNKWQDRVKVVHFSGENAAKPWGRILDEEHYEKYWPDRARDDDYMQWFAENFQGYHLWVRRDKEWLDTCKQFRSHGWQLQPFEIDENGDVYRKADEENPTATCVNLP